MSANFPPDCVGLVKAQYQHFNTPLTLRSGRVLEEYTLAYETYGVLNAEKDNAILICHALSGDHHAAGYYAPEDNRAGWWDSAIGPTKAIDTNRFFVVCVNNLGGCAGSSGPTSLNPKTNQPYGPDFPIVTVRDWVRSQARLADILGIETWAAVIGGSLGGMQVLRWSIEFPERLRHGIVIAAAPKLSAQNIAFNEIARQAITKDPDFHNGHYLQHNTFPKRGLMQARMLGHITYLSDDAMKQKFGRELKRDAYNYSFAPEFQVESYLHYQGEKFSHRFDANTYMLMTRALDYFDPTVDYNNDLVACLSHTQCRFLVVSFTSDWRFSPKRSEEIVQALVQADKPVSYACIDSNNGHDAFLMPIKRYIEVLSAYMQQIKIGIKHD